jgi:hypothetical protein
VRNFSFLRKLFIFGQSRADYKTLFAGSKTPILRSVSAETEQISPETEMISGEINTISGEINSVSGEIMLVFGEICSVSGEIESIPAKFLLPKQRIFIYNNRVLSGRKSSCLSFEPTLDSTFAKIKSLRARLKTICFNNSITSAHKIYFGG